MTAAPFPALWTDLPREVRDQVLKRLIARRLKLGGSEARRLVKAAPGEAVPASLEQRFFLEQQARFAGKLAWTIATPPMILDTVDPEAVRRAVAALARRHDVLSMTFAKTGDDWFLKHDPATPPPLSIVTLPLTAAVTGPELWVRRRYGAMLAAPFDPEKGPLWRAELIIRAGRGVLLSCFCSAIIDGESLHVIDRDLKALLAGEPEATPPAFDYADYAATQAAQIRAGRFEESLGWWQGALAGGPPQVAAAGRAPIGPAPLFEMLISPETGRRIDAYAAAKRTTAPAIFLTELMAALADLDGTKDVWVAAATATRDLAGTEEMVGTFARQVLVRHRLTDEPDQLAAVHGRLIEAMDQAPVPHLLVRRQLEADGHDPALAFRYVFNHRIVGAADDDDTIDRDLAFRAGPKYATAAREEDMLMMVLQSGDQRRLHWYLRADRFNAKAAERLLTGFHAALMRRLAGG